MALHPPGKYGDLVGLYTVDRVGVLSAGCGDTVNVVSVNE